MRRTAWERVLGRWWWDGDGEMDGRPPLPFRGLVRAWAYAREATVIAAGYRALARDYHPDVNTGDPWTKDLVKRINEVDAVVSDADRRRADDRE